MSNAWNTVYIDMEVDMSWLKNDFNKAVEYARDTWKKLDSELMLKLEMDYSQLKVAQLEASEVAKQMRKDYKNWIIDKKTLQEAEIWLKRISSQTSQASRVLENYKNTWDTAVSRLQAKFNSITDEIRKNRDELSNLWKSTKKIDEIIKKADQLQKEFQEGKISIKEYWNQLQKLQNQWQWVSWILEKLKSKMWTLTIASWIALIWKQVYWLWKYVLFLWDKLEQASISFETMTWSAEIAKWLLEDLSYFASNTPFELIWLRDTAKQLLAFGIDINNIIPTLKVLWDVSAWLSVPIEQIAYAYWQVRVAWRLMWWELMQFTNAWVPLIEYLSKVLWVAQKDIKKMVSEWKIWFTDVQKAFALMTSEWERFWNLMDKQTTTLWWMRSNLKDQFDKLLEWVWTDLLPFWKKVISVFSFLLDWVTKLYYWFKISFNFIDGVVWYTFLNIVNIFHKLFSFFWNIQENTKIFSENMWLAFENLPWTIGKFLDKWIEKIESFINFVWKWVKKIGDLLWVDTSWLWNIYLWRIWDSFWNQPEFKQFNLWTAGDLENSGAKYFKKQIDDILKIADEWWNKKRKLDTELKIAEIENNEEVLNNLIWNSWKIEDIKEEELKKEKERQEKLNDFLKDKAKKRLDNLKDQYDWLSSFIDDKIKGFKDNISDFDKQIESSTDKILDLQESLNDLENGKDSDLSNRFITIREEIEKLQDEIKRAEREWLSVSRARRYWEKTLKNIWAWSLGDFTGDEYLEILNKQNELNRLLEEEKLIQDNVSKSKIDEAIRIDNLSPTEKILEEINAKKEKYEEDLEIENSRLTELQELKNLELENLETFSEIKKNLEEKYANYSMELEAKITDTQYNELKTREDHLNASIDRQINKLNQLIAVANNAWISLSWTDLSWWNNKNSSSSSSSNSTTINNVFNQNISSNIDMNKVNKSIVNTMSDNSKWMSWKTI